MNDKRAARNSSFTAAARRTSRLALSLLALTLLAQAGAQASPHRRRGRAESPPKADDAARPARIPDVEVFDQNGRRLRFYTDLIKGRTVVVNFVFTTCTYVCPMQGASFAKLQAALGGRAGRDVHLISVSIDPAADTPQRLKAWGEKFGVGPGWTLVTGGKEQMDELLRALTGDGARRGEHSPFVFAGNFDRGVWVRDYGLAGPGRFLDLFDALARAPAAEPSAAAHRGRRGRLSRPRLPLRGGLSETPRKARPTRR